MSPPHHLCSSLKHFMFAAQLLFSSRFMVDIGWNQGINMETNKNFTQSWWPRQGNQQQLLLIHLFHKCLYQPIPLLSRTFDFMRNNLLSKVFRSLSRRKVIKLTICIRQSALLVIYLRVNSNLGNISIFISSKYISRPANSLFIWSSLFQLLTRLSIYVQHFITDGYLIIIRQDYYIDIHTYD